MATKRDYYEVLRLAKDASDNEIKKAYHKLSEKYHSDTNEEADAEEKFKEVSETYKVLGDSQRKAAYDQYCHAGTDLNHGGGTDGFDGFGDSGFGNSGFGGSEGIFDSFFGGGGSRSVDPSVPGQGADLRYTIQLKLEEAILGAEKEIKHNREDTRVTCGGSSAKPGTHPETCHRCRGSGTISVGRRISLGRMMGRQTCDVCYSTGEEIKESYSTCRGTGHEKEAHTVKVNVPAGVEDDQQMCLANQGEAGIGGGPCGNLYVVFRVEDSDIFDRDGAEIYCNLPVSPVQVALEGEVTVPTIHGDVKLRVPARTQAGTNLRLRGKGTPCLRGGDNGDQHVKVKPITPKNLDEEQKDTLWTFAKADGQNVTEQQEEGFFGKIKDMLGGREKK